MHSVKPILNSSKYLFHTYHKVLCSRQGHSPCFTLTKHMSPCQPILTVTLFLNCGLFYAYHSYQPILVVVYIGSITRTLHLVSRSAILNLWDLSIDSAVHAHREPQAVYNTDPGTTFTVLPVTKVHWQEGRLFWWNQSSTYPPYIYELLLVLKIFF